MPANRLSRAKSRALCSTVPTVLAVFAPRSALAGCVALVAAAVTALPAQAVAPAAVHGHGRSYMYIAGYSPGHGIILNDFDNSRVLAVRADGSHLRVLHKDAQATEVVGGLVEYFRPSEDDPGGRSYFFDLDNGRHGIVPRAWWSLSAGGGVWMKRRHNGWHLYYQPDTGGRAHDFGVMPGLAKRHGIGFNFGASLRGLVVTASSAQEAWRPRAELYPVPNSVARRHRLSTVGVSPSTLLLCPHVGTTIACTNDVQGGDIIGLSRNSIRSPIVRHSSTAVGDVVFANESTGHRYAYTTLDDNDPDNGPQCPCSIHFDNGRTIKGIVDAALATHGTRGSRVFYVKYTAHASALYRNSFGGGHPRLIFRAPRVH